MSEKIRVEGMSCENCEDTVENALKEVEGVKSATADLEENKATIEGNVEISKLIKAVENVGYKAYT